MAPVSYHMHKRLLFPVIPEAVKQIDDEQRALYMHAVFGLMEREVGKVKQVAMTTSFSFHKRPVLL